jgi:hypothetical protein
MPAPQANGAVIAMFGAAGERRDGLAAVDAEKPFGLVRRMPLAMRFFLQRKAPTNAVVSTTDPEEHPHDAEIPQPGSVNLDRLGRDASTALTTTAVIGSSWIFRRDSSPSIPLSLRRMPLLRPYAKTTASRM